MIRHVKFKFYLFFICAFCSVKASSQVNLKIGYTASYINSNINNQIFERYNESRPWLESKLDNLHFLHGIQLGLRYKLNAAAFELTWENATRARNALGEDPTSGVFFEKSLFYGINTFSFGLQNNFGAIGYGATIDSRRLKVQTKIGSSEEKRVILSSNGLSSKFYLSFNIPSGDFVSLSFQPYVQVPWKNINLFPIEEELFENSPNPVDQFDENLTVFGLTVVFYNGVQ